MRLHAEDLVAPQAPPARVRHAAQASHWAGELGKAQTLNWFHGALTRPAPAESAVKPGAPALQSVQEKTHSLAGRTAAPATPACIKLAAAGIEGTTEIVRNGVPRDPRNLLGSATTTLFSPHPMRCETSITSQVSTETSEGTPHRFVGEQEQAERSDGIRVHVETNSGEACVWLGIGGDHALVAARLAAVLPEVRRSAWQEGRRLGLVVCNGIPVDVQTKESS
jgi:hypothetical protein